MGSGTLLKDMDGARGEPGGEAPLFGAPGKPGTPSEELDEERGDTVGSDEEDELSEGEGRLKTSTALGRRIDALDVWRVAPGRVAGGEGDGESFDASDANGAGDDAALMLPPLLDAKFSEPAPLATCKPPQSAKSSNFISLCCDAK